MQLITKRVCHCFIVPISIRFRVRSCEPHTPPSARTSADVNVPAWLWCTSQEHTADGPAIGCCFGKNLLLNVSWSTTRPSLMPTKRKWLPLPGGAFGPTVSCYNIWYTISRISSRQIIGDDPRNFVLLSKVDVPIRTSPRSFEIGMWCLGCVQINSRKAECEKAEAVWVNQTLCYW